MNHSVKRKKRMKRALKIRSNIRSRRAVRLSVHRSSKHIYAQIISGDNKTVLASASTVDSALKGELKGTSNISAAQAVGTLLAKRATEAGVTKVAFDRSGFRYHGRVKALAEAAREGGIDF